MLRALSLALACLLLALSPARGSAVEAAYVVGPGDVLEISVWGQENLKRQLIVPPDGIVAFPLIKDVDVRGATVSAIREAVTEKLAPLVPDATVTVILLESKSLTAYVIGNVNRPGPFTIGLDTSVMQLLSMAGGFNPAAIADRIFVLRQADGRPQKLPFEYNKVLNGKNLDQNIVLQRGDVVVVP